MTQMKKDRSDSVPGTTVQAVFGLAVTALARRDHDNAYPRSSAQVSVFIRGKQPSTDDTDERE
jgi:hypothetical protein